MVAIVADNSVRVIKCPNWDTFTAEVRKSRVLKNADDSVRTPSAVLFRGHSDPSWSLSSTLERSLAFGEAFTVHDGGGKKVEHLRQLNGVDWYNDESKKVLKRFSGNTWFS